MHPDASASTATQQKSQHALAAEVLACIDSCRRRSALYPTGHPRCTESMQELRTSLAEFAEHAGRAFCFEAFERAAPQERDAAARAVEPTEAQALRQVLRRLRVKAVSIEKTAPAEELWKLCALLNQDPARAESGDQALKLRAGLDHVHFMELSAGEANHDLNSRVSPETAALEADGRALAADEEAFQKILGGVSRELRHKVQQVLAGKEMQERLVETKAVFQSHIGDLSPEAGAKMNLFGTLLSAALSRPELQGVVDLSEARVSEIVEETIRFIHGNIDALSVWMNSRPETTDSQVLAETIQKAIQTTDELAGLAGTMQAQKHRLEFLFHTATGSAPRERKVEAPAEAPGQAPKPAAPDARDAAAAGGSDQKPLESLIPVAIADAAFLASNRMQIQPLEGYLAIAFESIANQRGLFLEKKTWPNVISTVKRASASEAEMENGLLEGCRYQLQFPSPQLEELLGELLEITSTSPQTTARVVEKIAQLPAGAALSVAILKRLEQKQPRQALAVFYQLHRESKPEVRGFAEERILSNVRNIDAVVSWALEAPESFLQPRAMRQALAQQEANQIFTGFKRYFSTAKELDARRLLAGLSRGTPGVEDIIYAAMESRNPALRALAIASLWKSPSVEVLGVIRQILQKNNRLSRPCAEEIQATLESLTRIEGVAARDLCEEILTSKKLVRHVYRREIRQALLKLLRERRPGEFEK